MKNINIVGAGLVGSLLAIFLAKKGYRVSVYERRPDMRKIGAIGGRSINLALSDRGLKALKLVGLSETIRQIAIPMPGRMIHNLDGSEVFQPYGKDGQAINSVSRGELNKMLMDEAEKLDNVELHFDLKCTGVDRHTTQVHFKNDQTGERLITQPDLVFGAGGAFSPIRNSLQRTKRFNYSQEYLAHGYKELTIPATKNGKWQIEKNALHIWPRGSFMLIALPNLDGSFTCTLFLAYEGVPSFESLKNEADVMRFFEQYFPDVIPLMPDLVEDFFQNPTGSLVTIRCAPWTYGGRIALIGDASHAIVPFYGQGMNSGFEDCTVLHEIMEQHEQTGELDWAAVFKDYETSRKPDADAIADLAVYNFLEMRDSVANPNFLLRKKIEKQLHKRYPDKYMPLYSMVTFSHIRYSEAQRIGKLQDALFAKIMQLPNVASLLKSDEWGEDVETWLEAYWKEIG